MNFWIVISIIAVVLLIAKEVLYTRKIKELEIEKERLKSNLYVFNHDKLSKEAIYDSLDKYLSYFNNKPTSSVRPIKVMSKKIGYHANRKDIAFIISLVYEHGVGTAGTNLDPFVFPYPSIEKQWKSLLGLGSNTYNDITRAGVKRALEDALILSISEAPEVDRVLISINGDNPNLHLRYKQGKEDGK